MTKNKQFDKSKGILIVVIALLLLVILGLVATYPQPSDVNTSSNLNEPRVNLGSMQYIWPDDPYDKVVVRDDATINELRLFLEEKAEKDSSENCAAIFNVTAWNEDENQVLLNYGCNDDTNARMFAIKKEGEWRTISPTNQFDVFFIPGCEHVNEHSIDTKVAPVCVNNLNSETEEATYSVRS